MQVRQPAFIWQSFVGFICWFSLLNILSNCCQSQTLRWWVCRWTFGGHPGDTCWNFHKDHRCFPCRSLARSLPGVNGDSTAPGRTNRCVTVSFYWTFTEDLRYNCTFNPMLVLRRTVLACRSIKIYGSLKKGKVTTSSFTWRTEAQLSEHVSQKFSTFSCLKTQTFTTNSWSNCTATSLIKTVTSLVQDTPLRPRSSFVTWTLHKREWVTDILLILLIYFWFCSFCPAC